MEIQGKVIIGFLKKIAMEDEHSLTDCLLDFTKDGLRINAISTTNMVGVSGILFTSAFKTYEEIGKVGFSDFDKVIRVFERFNGLISMKKEGNLFTLKGDNKNAAVELMDEKFFDIKPIPNLEYETSFNIESSKLSDIFKDVKMSSDSTIVITSFPGRIRFSNTGKYKFETFIESIGMKEGVKAEFGVAMIHGLARLEGNLIMQIKTDYPMFVTEKSDINIINVMIAPFIDKD